MESPKFYKQNTLPNLNKSGEGPTITDGKIGPYKVDTLLSTGGMSYLYLGMHPNGSPIVIKVLSPKYTTHPEMVKRFLKEAQIIALTNHPNIIKLYGQGTWEHGLYIAMEFVQGVSLKQFIMQQNLSTKSALDIILQVAYALLHLHTHGVIHRDLKPENILITEEGQVKVIDFGIAQLMQERTHLPHTRTEPFLGTPSYMSPEQKKNPLNVTFATDIYSLGVITFELIVGKFSYGSIQLSLLPAPLREVIERALHPSVEERCQDIVDFIAAISGYLKTVPMKTKNSLAQNVKDMWKELENSHKRLLPPSTPKWDTFDLGFASCAPVVSLYAYYDFFRFSDDSYLALMAELCEERITFLAEIGLLKGMVHSLIHQTESSQTRRFQPTLFITDLNAMLSRQSDSVAFALHLLHLLPASNQFSFISCGFQPIVHFTFNSTTPRFLKTQNPLLGTHSHYDFYETTESYSEGDVLIIHSLNPILSQAAEETQCEETVRKALPSLIPLSAQTQAEGLATELAKTAHLERPHVVLTIHRIA